MGDEAIFSARLSPREVDVLRALARGLSNKSIASELGVGVQAVKWHLCNVYAKLGYSSYDGISPRVAAAQWASRELSPSAAE